MQLILVILLHPFFLHANTSTQNLSWSKIQQLDTGSRGGSRTAATSKMECFVITVNGYKPLTIITKHSILDVAAVLDPPLGSSFLLKIHMNFCYQYAKLRSATYEKIHLDLLQSFPKMKLKVHSQLSKKIVENSVVPLFVLSIT